MLLINELKEYKLINGSIGIVKEIMFEHKDWPRHIPYELPACVIIEFKESNISDETESRTDLENNTFQLIQPPFVVIKNIVLLHLFH